MSLTERIQSLGRGIQLILDPSCSSFMEEEYARGAFSQLVQVNDLTIKASQQMEEEEKIRLLDKFYGLEYAIAKKAERVSCANLRKRYQRDVDLAGQRLKNILDY